MALYRIGSHRSARRAKQSWQTRSSLSSNVGKKKLAELAAEEKLSPLFPNLVP